MLQENQTGIAFLQMQENQAGIAFLQKYSIKEVMIFRRLSCEFENCSASVKVATLQM